MTTIEEQNIADDDEFGAPESVQIDLNRQINHLMQSFSNDNIQLHWKISQHAAEIDALKMALAEREAEVEALNAALQSEVEHSSKLEGLQERSSTQTLSALNLADDPQPADGFLALASGQPGLGDGER
jgi:hypothetical protein